MPKIRGRSLAEHRQETRNRLFDALKSLLTTEGFDALTLSEIAQAAGVGRTSVYNHFPDKESLLIAMIQHETDEYLAVLKSQLAGAAHPLERLRRYVRCQAQLDRSFHVAPGPDLRTVLSPNALSQLRDHARTIEELLRSILKEGIAQGLFVPMNLDRTIPIINAAIFGRALPPSAGPDREAAIRAMETFILRGAGASPDALATLYV